MYPDLFSVIADNYNIYDTGNEINFNENLRFFINNKSSYTNTYHYSLDLISDNLENQFINQNGSITIGPNESSVLNFIPIHNEIESSEIQLTVFPENHEYALKTFNFTVSGNVVTGDLNSDGLLNILDVISLVNIIISGQNSSVVSDLNNDNQTNILDVVLLVSEILNN